MYIAIWLLFLCIVWFNIFIYLLWEKLGRLEIRIKRKFISRTNLVPSIFEVSKNHITKHGDIFREILRLRKQEFNESENSTQIAEMIQTEWLIHHELNFIFRVCNTNPKLVREGKFIYLREVIVDMSIKLWKDIDLYRKITQTYNSLVRTNKFLIIWLFVPMRPKIEI